MNKCSLVTLGAVAHTHTEYWLNKISNNTCGKTSVTFVAKNNTEKMKTSFM